MNILEINEENIISENTLKLLGLEIKFNNIGSLVSTPGIPLGTHLKDVLAPGLSLPFLSLNLNFLFYIAL